MNRSIPPFAVSLFFCPGSERSVTRPLGDDERGERPQQASGAGLTHRSVPAFAAALFLGCAPAPASRPPVPDVASQVDRLEVRLLKADRTLAYYRGRAGWQPRDATARETRVHRRK